MHQQTRIPRRTALASACLLALAACLAACLAGSAPPAAAQALTALPANAQLELAAALMGTYVHQPVQNDWHIGAITRDGSGYRWTNKAGASWLLAPFLTALKLQTGNDNPYYAQYANLREFSIVIEGGRLVGFRFGADLFARNPPVPLTSLGAAPVAAAMPFGAAAVLGRNVTAVDFGSLAGQPLGQYRMTGPLAWAEVPASGPIVLRFEEVGRDDSSVFLVDRSRAVKVRLDVGRQMLYYSDSGSPQERELYRVRNASANPVPGVPLAATAAPPQGQAAQSGGLVAVAPTGSTAATGPGLQALNNYLGSLQYSREQLLSVQPDSVTGIRAINDPANGMTRATQNSGAIIITEKKTYSLKDNLSELIIFGASDATIYPGALVYLDRALMEGKPREIVLPRAPVTIFTTLPGMANSKRTVANPRHSTMQDAVNGLTDSWLNNARPGYSTQAAQSYTSVSRFSTQEQASLALGLSAKWATGAAKSMLTTKSSTKKNTFVALTKQVFYTVNIDPPAHPGGAVFASTVTVDDLRNAQINGEGPPGYIAAVSYGRIFMIRIETDDNMDSSQVQASLNNKFTSVKASGTINASNQTRSSRATCTIVALGGGADKAAPAQTEACGGGKPGELNLDAFNAYIIAGATFTKDNPGSVIAYRVKFLKDGSDAVIGQSTTYTEETSTEVKERCVTIKQNGAYIATFDVAWQEPTDNGGVRNMGFNSGGMTVGEARKVCMPADSKQVAIIAHAAGGIGWVTGMNRGDVTLPGPNNACYSISGTAFKTFSNMNCDPNTAGIQVVRGTQR